MLETDTVRGAMKKFGVVPLKADNTRSNPLIDEWLRRFGKGGVPMYIVIHKDPSKKDVVLPEVITPGMVADALKAAAEGSEDARR